MRATVIIPTFDHGPLLKYSVESALKQTVADIEIFVVGDGVPAEHREAVFAAVRSDSRIRFFDFEKGARHGEIWRHEALGKATGEIVCYLSDDDLWFPEHVEVMEELLADADFANTLPVHAEVTGELNIYAVDLALPEYHERFRAGHNRVPLTCAAHTMAAYRRSAGWRTTPAGIPTDLYMWQEMLRPANNRAISGFQPTAVNFPTPFRKDWTLKEREAELKSWSRRILDPAERRRIPLLILEGQGRLAASSFLESEKLRERMAAAESRAAQLDQVIVEAKKAQELTQALQEASEKNDEIKRVIGELKTESGSLRSRLAQVSMRKEAAERGLEKSRQELQAVSGALRHLERVHHEMADTAAWRMREKVLKLPLIGSAARWAARALIRAGDR